MNGVLAQAPASVVKTDLDGLPAGVTVQPGRIAVEAIDARDAASKLMALAMAIGNDFAGFDRAISKSKLVK